MNHGRVDFVWSNQSVSHFSNLLFFRVKTGQSSREGHSSEEFAGLAHGDWCVYMTDACVSGM